MEQEYQVNTLRSSLAWILFFLLIQKATANPIPTPLMNEVKIGSNGFILEIVNNGMFLTLDGCYLTSNSSTAYFKPGISGEVDFLLITQDSLLTPLSLDPAGDVLTFHGPAMDYVEAIIFDGDSSHCHVAPPLPGQSICLDLYSGWYYLDNTPTLGAPNDYLNAGGIVEGYITSLTGDTLQNVKISRRFGLPVYSDSSGYFALDELAIYEELIFQKTSYWDGYLWLQIWPDSLQTIHVVIEKLVDIEDPKNSSVLQDFQFFQNYPNPFNSNTALGFLLPDDADVELNIFDMLGNKIRSVVNGNQAAGWYRVIWDGKDNRGINVASGIYIYRLTVNNQSLNRKMLLLR